MREDKLQAFSSSHASLMPQKRRLTGYQEDTGEIIKSRINQWKERAKSPLALNRNVKGKTSSHAASRSKRASSPQGKDGRPQRPAEVEGDEIDNVNKGMASQKRLDSITHRPILKNSIRSDTPRSHERRSEGDLDKPKDHVKFTRKVLMEEMKKTLDDRGEAPCVSGCFRRLEGKKTGCVVPPRFQSILPPIEQGLATSMNPRSSLQASTDKVCPGEKRSSSAPRTPTAQERQLFRLARTGNVTCVQRFLTGRSKTNVNARNFEGETALRIAVKMGNEALVCFLSSLKDIDLDDILLYAISYKQYPIVKLLCENFDLDRKYSVNCEFPKWVTPLSLAAEVGSYEIVYYLLNCRCHELIPEPHRVRCRCQLVCSHIKEGDQLEVALRSLHIYSALSQPSYYIHLEVDPFTRSFQLCRDLAEMSEFFVAFKPCFEKLAERVQKFAADLIAECRESEEVRTVLAHSVGPKTFWERLEKNKLPTLMMALDLKQKCFVAQSNVQVTLKHIWTTDYHSSKTNTSMNKAFIPIKRLLLIPYIYYLLLVKPHSINTHRFASPVNKMISSLACYMVFLAFIFYANIKCRSETRAPYSLKNVEMYIILFVLAYSLGLIRQAIALHPRRFIRNGWNLYDFSTLLAFWLTIAFWISAQVHYYLVDSDMRSLERKYWANLDPVLVADGFFVIGSVLAYLKLFYYAQIDDYFGPMQTAMNSMLKEFIKYSVFWLLILLSFTVALGKFYSYYDGMKYVDKGTGDTLTQEDAFVSFKSTFKTLFWGIFGLASYSTADVIIENIKTGNDTFLNEHNFTESIGYFAFGSYTVMMSIVVMNVVIATMGAALTHVLADVDTEWKFNNAQINIYYACQSVLPPPFNLLPHSYMWTMAKKEPSPLKCEPPPKEPMSFDELVKTLILRYFHTKAVC